MKPHSIAADPFLPRACERAGRFPIVFLHRSQLYSRSFLRGLVTPGRSRKTLGCLLTVCALRLRDDAIETETISTMSSEWRTDIAAHVAQEVIQRYQT
jgi:hypothetical protein